MKIGQAPSARTLLQTCAARRGSLPACPTVEGSAGILERGKKGERGGGLLERRTLARSGSRCERGAAAGATYLPGVASKDFLS